jgi:hypothetical protein
MKKPACPYFLRHTVYIYIPLTKFLLFILFFYYYYYSFFFSKKKICIYIRNNYDNIYTTSSSICIIYILFKTRKFFLNFF